MFRQEQTIRKINSEKITRIWKVKIQGGNKQKEYLKSETKPLFLGKKNLTIGKEKKCAICKMKSRPIGIACLENQSKFESSKSITTKKKAPIVIGQERIFSQIDFENRSHKQKQSSITIITNMAYLMINSYALTLQVSFQKACSQH